jgi:hypothetical protein
MKAQGTFSPLVEADEFVVVVSWPLFVRKQVQPVAEAEDIRHHIISHLKTFRLSFPKRLYALPCPSSCRQSRPGDQISSGGHNFLQHLSSVQPHQHPPRSNTDTNFRQNIPYNVSKSSARAALGRYQSYLLGHESDPRSSRIKSWQQFHPILRTNLSQDLSAKSHSWLYPSSFLMVTINSQGVSVHSALHRALALSCSVIQRKKDPWFKARHTSRIVSKFVVFVVVVRVGVDVTVK